MSEKTVREELEKRLGGASALPGGDTRALTSGLAERFAEQMAAPLFALIAYDVTISMEEHIKVVERNISEVARRLFEEETGIRIAIWGVGDHNPSDPNGRGALYVPEGFESGYRSEIVPVVQTNDFVGDGEALKRQIRGLKRVQGFDGPEGYECLYRDAALTFSRLRSQYPFSKAAAIVIGDQLPHGMGHVDHSNHGDHGCPENVDYRVSLPHLKSTVDLFYLVSAATSGHTKELQESQVDPTNPNEKFIPLGSMVEYLPQLLIAAIKQAINPAHAAEYLRRLGGEGNVVAGYLGLPPLGGSPKK